MMTELPRDVQAVMKAYLRTLENKLPGLVTGLYLHGSIALGAFDPRFSDIDFLALLSRRCTKADLHVLAEVHQVIAAHHPKPDLEGGYLQWEELGQTDENIAPYPYYHDGKLQPGKHGEVNVVTWWLVKNQGVTLLGPVPLDLELEASGDDLSPYTLSNLNTYWAAFLKQPLRMSWFLFDDGMQWIVLGVLRQYYTLREQKIISKLAAGKDALNYLAPKWHRIVREAINIRQRSGISLYKSRIGRATEAIRFLRFIITDCNTKYNT